MRGFRFFILICCGGGTGGGGFYNTAGSITSGWGAGTYPSAYDCAEDHYDRHGSDVGAIDFIDYLRKAEAFKELVLKKRIKGVFVSGRTPDVYRYKYSGKYIDLQHHPSGTKLIISYGK